MSPLQTGASSTWRRTVHVLGDEGFRLFFPLGAIYAAIWPFLWIIVHGYNLPMANAIPSSIWHAHEMIIGAFGAALLGFITTSIPEWTDTDRLHGPPLFWLAGVWGIGRVIGLVGAEPLNIVGALADVLWIGFLALYVLRVSLVKKTTRLFGFTLWLTALCFVEAATRYAFIIEDVELAHLMGHCTGFVFMGLLGMALARITVPVTNLILDPSEETSPFRPHPGRLNLAPGLIGVAVTGELLGLSMQVTGFLMIAAGAAFFDRVAEAFVGREFFRAEIAVLAGASALAGAGLLLVGLGRLGFPINETTGLHVAFMGGLGLGVMAVFSIAGLLHTGQALVFSKTTKFAMLLLVAGTALRVLPELGVLEVLLGHYHALASSLWALSFLVWLRAYWPAFSDPATLDTHNC